METTTPLITIPLKEYLESRWGDSHAFPVRLKELERLRAVIALYNISAAEQETQWFHIRETDFDGTEFKDEHGERWYSVWRIADWETEYQKWKEQKAKSEEDNKNWFHKTELEQELNKQLCLAMGMEDDSGKKLVKELVLKILKTKNLELAKAYGVDISKLNVKMI